MSSNLTENHAISFAERVLTLLDQGSFTSTYKYAVLLGLMDVVLERTSKNGIPPDFITTRQLADKVIEIYWPHSNPFAFNSKKDKMARLPKRRVINKLLKINEFQVINIKPRRLLKLKGRAHPGRRVRARQPRRLPPTRGRTAAPAGAANPPPGRRVGQPRPRVPGRRAQVVRASLDQA